MNYIAQIVRKAYFNLTSKVVNAIAVLSLTSLTACSAAQKFQPAPAVPIQKTAPTYSPPPITPPPVAREFRAAWISSVGENSWLNGLTGRSTAEQKAALIAMLDRAQQLKLNAVIFQVRPACDALYFSSIEPWCEHLTGLQGRAPQPYYDPLQFVIEEAHKRGLELHAWFNPYRAHHADAKSPFAQNHISRTRPDLVRSYGKYLWLDPGERDVQDYSLRVVMDIVKRYDIDGVHFDDYFYPYREKDYAGREVDFPDNASWKKFGVNSRLARDDWRRENVNSFIQRVQASIRAAKPWVKFGISPFGIWRPGNPPQIRGKDAYAELYADARKWIANGWADYFSPQLYWSIDNKEQSFPVLLHWWSQQNVKSRHLWPGIDTTKVGNDRWKPDEIANQIWLTRKQSGDAGAIFWGMKNLVNNRVLANAIAHNIYVQPALIPTSPWMTTTHPPPQMPRLWAKNLGNTVKVSWEAGGNGTIRQWVLQTKSGNQWTTKILQPGYASVTLNGPIDAVAVTAVDRMSRASAPAVIQLSK